MRISARNQIKGTVVEVRKGATTSHVRVDIGGGQIMTSSITNEAVDELGIKKWNIDRERAALTAPDRVKLASGSELAALPSTGIALALSTPADAKLPTPPERAPKEGTFAGFTTFKNPPRAGLYTVSLSAGGWVDLMQDGRALKPKAYSAATDCDGIRKTMKFQISASPFVLQISGTKENSMSVAILPTE